MNTLNAELSPLNLLLDDIFSTNFLDPIDERQGEQQIHRILGDIDSQLIHLNTIRQDLKAHNGPNQFHRSILRASNKRTRLCLESLRVQFELLTQRSMNFDDTYTDNVMTLRHRVGQLRVALCAITRNE
ncbi:hypothetical protein ACPV5L_09530 [Vibrio astriarenae]|jgi:hypothetical protein|uniref:DUF3135 domain-containing protein n=1 Tax=Vibrio agarivorans TaxID=153622 RepID=A0ABT7Y4K1_9VIBR|nr:hypothetical protein [Vibrio agarivorans]MDN2482983.1 hypothetical protein [Vibrio agarivorans]